MLSCCAAGPADSLPEGGWPWNATACSASAVGQQCLTYCNWPAFSGGGYYITCLPDGSWSGPGGFCFPRSCSGSPGPEWTNSSCAFMSVGSQCTATCPSGQQGIGYVASCTIGGWQVTARDCSPIIEVPTCNSLPTPNAPAGSKGWAADCVGRRDGETCQAACDVSNLKYFEPGQNVGYSVLCQAGQWVLQPGGVCKACGTRFASQGSGPSETGFYKFGVLPTNDGSSVLVADYNKDRIAVYSARDLTYQGEWLGVQSPHGLAAGSGSVYVSTLGRGKLHEVYSSGQFRQDSLYPASVGSGGFGVAVAGDGKVVVTYPDVGLIGRFNSDGTTDSSFLVASVPAGLAGNMRPGGVAIDRNGRLVIADHYNGRVLSFDANGGYRGVLISGLATSIPAGVALDAFDNFYVVENTALGKLNKYDSSGTLLRTYGGPLSYPKGVAVGADGVVWVTEQFGSVWKITCM
ncbi:hypothetical protein OEZ86_013560 [Tetradesmus obliquus]|nr:hypothetical protein OEZ86_013560 [Tetradesmus obliquus]